MRKTSIVGLIVAAALFSGCAALGSLGSSGTNSSSQTESLATASGPGPSPANIVGRSTKFIFMSPSAVLAGSRDVEKALVQEQCMFHSANPPFLVPALGQKWVFIGRMNQGPTMQALNYRSIFTLGLTGAQQLNGWPVSLVALSDFSDNYLNERLPMLTKAQPDVRSDVLAEYVYNARRIRTVTDWVIRSYSPGTQCGPRR
ncbi:MAG TPA: hypothetical protein VKT27_03670 [Candidatus Binataceae bacterium]|nr:hypothetical protein [Candidatus Binataceae bacterium]